MDRQKAEAKFQRVLRARGMLPDAAAEDLRGTSAKLSFACVRLVLLTFTNFACNGVLCCIIAFVVRPSSPSNAVCTC